MENIGNSNQISRAYLDSLLIETRYMDSGTPDTHFELYGKKVSSPIMTAALSHLDHFMFPGAAEALAKGAADAGVHPAIAVIGDSTFTHSGMTSLLDAVNDNAAITVILSDSLTTAMTGGQDSAGTHKFEAICLALGVEREHLHVVVPLPKNMEEITRIIREEMEYKGVSVIIPQRECMQTLARKNRQKRAQ
jgi:indolepyruvate ferredoxin oxidoreductase alpha subunit